MKDLRALLPFIFFLWALASSGQGVGIGQWRDLLPYDNTIAVSKIGDRVYCATPYSLFYYDQEDYSIQRLSKINGLSDIGVSYMDYNEEAESLVIAYTNTNIDLVRNGSIINVSDIKRKEILGNKTINKVMNRGPYAYLSCGFGIVVLDVQKHEVKDTYYIGAEGSAVNVLDMAYNDTSLFAATDEGVYYADISDPNLSYFANWKKIQTLPVVNGAYNLVHVYNDYLLVNYFTEEDEQDILYAFIDGDWVNFDPEGSARTKSMSNGPQTLLVAYEYFAKEYDSDLNTLVKIYTYGDNVTPTPNDIVSDDGQYYWIADRSRGLVKTWAEGFEREIIKPQGAPTTDIYDMATGDGDLWLVPGGMSGTWGNIWKAPSLYSFIDESWKTYNQYNIPGLDTLRDMVAVKVDPLDPGHVFTGSWFRGVVELRNGEMVNMYHAHNSSLQIHELEGGEVLKVGGIDFDSENNAWFTNSGAEDILSVRRENGTSLGEWQSYHLGAATIGIYVRQLMIDDYDQKWMVCRVTASTPANPYYLYVFDEKKPAGDRVRGLRSGTGNGNLPGNAVYSMASDLDGEVWIGTDEGIAIFYSPLDVLTTNNYDAERPLVDFDGYVQYLLETETVRAIAVDGANRKWIGTERSGLFLLSEDGTEQIYHFTEDNSPLLSNTVTTLQINGLTGEVYIGTTRGLIGFKGDSTEPMPDNEDVYVYPNPVRPGFAGPIAIRGLVRNASVKITDINGNLIYEAVAEGGQATWNGYDFNGRRASSGVYLVFISNEDGSETIVTKILFLN